MNRFWTRFVKPIVETAAPRRMMEIGADSGRNTELLLNYCQQTGCILEIVDPAPQPALHDVMAKFTSGFIYHPLKSHSAISQIAPVDLVLLDGDHNWFTVFTELKLLFRKAQDDGVAPPIALFHDVAWPYARRDMYYTPRELALSDRHPYAYRGMVQGRSELVEGAYNGRWANALHEGGPRNGVLTAIEDFRASCGVETAFHKLPFYNGLGILVPKERSTASLRDLIEGFFSSESLLETCVALESDSMSVRADLEACEVKLTQQSAALHRAKTVIDELGLSLVQTAGRKGGIGALLRLNGAGFVQEAYRVILGREADAGGLALYTERLEGKGRAEKIEILSSLAESPEGVRRGVRLPGLEAYTFYYRARQAKGSWSALRRVARRLTESEA